MENKELTPKTMTATIITTMKYGGCSPKHIHQQFIGYMYVFFTGLIFVLLALKWVFTPPSTITVIVEDCIMLSGFLQICAKYYTCVKSAKVLSDMLDSLYDEFWSLDTMSKDHKNEAMARYKIANRLSKLYGTIVMIAVTLFCIQAKLKPNKALVMDIWFPYKHILKISPYYESVFIFEVLLLTSSVYLAVIPLDRLFILLTCYICQQFKMISVRIMEINSTKSNEDNFDVVRTCVKHHNLILKFISHFDALYSRLFLPVIASNFVLITITMYGLIVEETLYRKLANLFIYAAVTGQLFAYCVAGQFIQDEGMLVGEAAYNCNWYETVGSDSKQMKIGLCLMILRSQRKIEMSVGGVLVLSMESFAAVVRATFSFLTFIANARK